MLFPPSPKRPRRFLSNPACSESSHDNRLERFQRSGSWCTFFFLLHVNNFPSFRFFSGASLALFPRRDKVEVFLFSLDSRSENPVPFSSRCLECITALPFFLLSFFVPGVLKRPSSPFSGPPVVKFRTPFFPVHEMLAIRPFPSSGVGGTGVDSFFPAYNLCTTRQWHCFFVFFGVGRKEFLFFLDTVKFQQGASFLQYRATRAPVFLTLKKG